LTDTTEHTARTRTAATRIVRLLRRIDAIATHHGVTVEVVPDTAAAVPVEATLCAVLIHDGAQILATYRHTPKEQDT